MACKRLCERSKHTGASGLIKQARGLRVTDQYTRHKNIIRILDSAVVQDPEGDGKIVYLFLPLYKARAF
jgi:serine/threonine kinase 16